MSYLPRRIVRVVAVSVLGLSATGCLCPPCPEDASAQAAANIAVGSRLILWNGDGEGVGTAQGWEGCDTKTDPKCKVKVSAVPGSGVGGGTAVRLRAVGAGYLGLGWNLYGWYPENAGTDITPYTHLTFQIRVKAKSPEASPDAPSVGVLLGASANENNSATVPVERYAKGFADGEWHEVSMPISQFLKGKGAKFDVRSFWEFRIATWSAGHKDFDLFVDDIAVEKK